MIDSTLDLEKDRRVGLVVVIAQAKFEPVAIAVDCVPVSVESVRVQVQAERGIGEVRLTGPVFVDVQVTLNVIADAPRLLLGDVVFQLVTADSGGDRSSIFVRRRRS